VTLEGELVAEQANAVRRVSGESRIQSEPGAVWRVWLEPEDVRAYPGAVQAILGADLVVVGPGSLFTSVLPNLLIREIRQALAATRALKVYICNVATQAGETDGFSARDHLEAIRRHIGALPFQAILVNNSHPAQLPQGMEWVGAPLPEAPSRVLQLDLADAENPGHHDPNKLTAALMSLLQRRAAFQHS
jgi:uncharacterized cofD-like protein